MKNTGLWLRTALIIAITLIGIYLVFGPRRVPTASDFTWQGIKSNLEQNINLGLDLKGGSHLVMRVKADEYLKTLTGLKKMTASASIVRHCSKYSARPAAKCRSMRIRSRNS